MVLRFKLRLCLGPSALRQPVSFFERLVLRTHDTRLSFKSNRASPPRLDGLGSHLRGVFLTVFDEVGDDLLRVKRHPCCIIRRGLCVR